MSNGEFDYKNESKAVFEYIERLVCQTPPAKEIQYLYANDKHTIPLNQLGFQWTDISFDPLKSKVRFIKGISLKTGIQYWVPSVFAYYFDNHFDEWNHFAGNSNGNALGLHFEDALERAILEFIERDKFIKYWYLNDGILQKIPKRLLGSQLERKIEYFDSLGYHSDFFNILNEPRAIFSVWCLLRSTDKNNPVFSLTALGADTSLTKAAKKAFVEASSMYFSRIHVQTNRLSASPAHPNIMEKNIRHYFSYERAHDFNDLFASVKSIQEMDRHEQEKSDTIVAALSAYQDIIYIPIKSPLLNETGLYEVKVVGLGGNSMYFNLHNSFKKGRIPGSCPFA